MVSLEAMKADRDYWHQKSAREDAENAKLWAENANLRAEAESLKSRLADSLRRPLPEDYRALELQVGAMRNVVEAALVLDAATKSEEGDGRTWSRDSEIAADELFKALKEVREPQKRKEEAPKCPACGTPLPTNPAIGCFCQA